MTITVYTKRHCPKCAMTRKFMDSRGVTYQTVNVEDDPAALTLVKDLGYAEAPVTVVRYTDGRQEHWSGARPDLIRANILTRS